MGTKKITATVTISYEVESDLLAEAIELYKKDGTTIEEELKNTLIDNVKDAFEEEARASINVDCIVEVT